MELMEAPNDPNEAVTYAARKAMGLEVPPKQDSFRGTMRQALGPNAASAAKAAIAKEYTQQLQVADDWSRRMEAIDEAEELFRARGLTPPPGLRDLAGASLDAGMAQAKLDSEKDLSSGPSLGQWRGEPRETKAIEYAMPHLPELADAPNPARTAAEVAKEMAAGVAPPPPPPDLTTRIKELALELFGDDVSFTAPVSNNDRVAGERVT
jgi:hypothetical protein